MLDWGPDEQAWKTWGSNTNTGRERALRLLMIMCTYYHTLYIAGYICLVRKDIEKACAASKHDRQIRASW